MHSIVEQVKGKVFWEEVLGACDDLLLEEKLEDKKELQKCMLPSK